jgi:hypothetical protein
VKDEPIVDTEEIARVLRLYEGPSEPRVSERAGSRRARSRPVVAIVALVVAAVATAAVLGLVTGRDRARTHAAIAPTGCTATLALDGRRYVERAVTAREIQLGRSLGDGILRRCGSAAAAATATALTGIGAPRAVGIGSARSQIFVGPRCARVPAGRLLSCLRAP